MVFCSRENWYGQKRDSTNTNKAKSKTASQFYPPSTVIMTSMNEPPKMPPSLKEKTQYSHPGASSKEHDKTKQNPVKPHPKSQTNLIGTPLAWTPTVIISSVHTHGSDRSTTTSTWSHPYHNTIDEWSGMLPGIIFTIQPMITEESAKYSEWFRHLDIRDTRWREGGSVWTSSVDYIEWCEKIDPASNNNRGNYL